MTNRKTQFQKDWLEMHWDEFVADGIEDSHGRIITVSDALELTRLESEQIDAAFRAGACATHEAIEVIAKKFLLSTVVDDAWRDHLAAEAEMMKRMLCDNAYMAFENYEMRESAR